MSEQTRFIDEIRDIVEDLGFELVDLRQSGSSRRPRVQIRIDRPGSTPGSGVTVDDCARASRRLEQFLDSSGVLGERYVLEVSSPGIERPVRWPEHWRRFVGEDVNVKLPGRGRVRATIVSADDETAVLRPARSDEEVEVSIDDSLKATLAVDWD